MKKHRLERAIVLGLMLSTSIYGTSFAMDTKAEMQETTTQTVTLNEFKNNELNSTQEPIDGVSKDNDAYNISKNIIIKGEYTTTTDKNGNIVYNVPQWWVNSPNKVNVEDNVNVVFDDVSLREPVITGNGNITINNSKTGNPIFVGADIQANNLVLNTNGGNGIYAYGHDVFLDVNNLEINSTANGIIQEAKDNTKETDIYINDTDSINIHSSGSWAIHCNAISSNANDIYMQSDRENSIINAMGANGVSNSSPDGGTFLKADNINIGAWSYYGVIAVSGKLDITAKNDIIIADIADDDTKKGNYAIQAAEADSGMLTINAQNGSTTIIGREGVFTNRDYKNGQIKITSKENNNILAKTHTLQATQEKIDDGNIIVTGKNNYIVADSNIVNQKFNPDFGNGLAISPEKTSITKLTATDDGYNIIKGAIVIEKGASEVYIDGNDNEVSSNYVNNNIVSSIHSKEGIVELKGKNNQIYTNATDTQKEHAVWAQQGGKINIDGQTTIVASNANKNTDIIDQNGQDTGIEQDGNSLGIAITAGTGTITDDKNDILSDFKDEDGSLKDVTDDKRSTVNITNASGSSITGDIVSGYGGLINIGMDVNNKARDVGTVENIAIKGNALAANGGKLNINLGNNGTWTGRADDYGDAGYGPDAQNHQNFYNPAFSNDILEGGTVNLTMGDNSTWNVDGQSWITSVTTTGNATIDLIKADTDKNITSHALTIGTLTGDANINMDLNRNRNNSDLLYIKKANGEYDVTLAKAVTTDDMYADGFDGLRFATVGEGSNVTFNVSAKDAGAFNVEYVVGTDDYDTSTENEKYNGTEFNGNKVGDTAVDEFFATPENTSTETTPSESASRISLFAAEPTTEVAETKETATTKATTTNATNHKLIAVKNESISNENLSDAGKTILNMGKANYSQAVYLDTLNKRLGEARYLEGDEGLWVRMRHDKIDKDSSYEITNNMYELGYDKKYESKDKNGYHRKGVALDYMDGDTSYDDIAGSGETNRKGIWLYDTWFGNKGHYTDYVLKWGHLENSFDLYTKTRGEKVSGEYNNDVYSLSAEWGYKDPLKNGWYFEPQTQLQYARVTGADYETSQGTQVSVDGIDSLIARAGFRFGKDFGEEKKSTFYVKADVLHEFLGDQDITVIDKTTDGRVASIGYDNDGTWYSVGLGFSTMLSDNSYAFLDVEKIFGNDNDNSYQINGGFNWLL